MRTQRLGSAGPELSVIGYGAWEAGGDAWGPNASDEAVVDAMLAAVDAGITWIDTAEVYGRGTSERLVGRAVAGLGEEVAIATKVAPTSAGGTGVRPEEVHAACAGSLERLGRERIDLYQLHRPDPGVPIEESWGAMAELQDAGLVRWIGVSNFTWELIERCHAIRHVDALQQELSMVALEHRDLIRRCGEAGIGVVTYGPLGFGLLTGSLTRAGAASLTDWRAGRFDRTFGPEGLDRAFGLIEGLRVVAEEVGASVAQLALAWNVHQPGVTSAIAGSRDPRHVRENAAAGDLELDDATLARLDALLA